MMTNPRNEKPNFDDQLADYSDRILGETAVNEDEAAFAPDPELRALEQTALRLKNSFDIDDPNEASIQQMHTNIIRKWKQEKSLKRISFWQKWGQIFNPSGTKWRSRRSRQRAKLALSLAAVILLLIISIPFWNSAGEIQPGTSGQGLTIYILIPIFGLLILALWLFRRKP